ncbi:MAG: ketopantoate reductase family protein [Proteobacteria bacterium]|nr:ketopantoate reductase family protein [Pseudomonadota bacterium]
MKHKKIAIVGMGPVGGILAAHLIQSGCDVTVIDLFREHLNKMRGEELVIDGVTSLATKVSRAFTGVSEAALAGVKFDLVFICVKATAVESFVSVLPQILTESGVVVSFQNGLDTEAVIVETLGEDKSIRGVVNYAGNLTGVGRIHMTFFNPPNYIGAAAPGNIGAEAKAKEITDGMNEAELDCEFSQNIKGHVWEKVIRNAAVMPISTLTGMDMAQVMASPSGLAMMKRLLSESMEVSAASGFPFDQHFFDETLDYYKKAGHHLPSMLGDVQDGRRTEIEFLNQRIAEYGQSLGIETPYSYAVSNLIQCIDELNAQRQRKSD